MVGFVSAVVLLVYVGRVLAWAWGTKPLEAGDVVFLLPIVVVAVLIRRRAIRPRLSQPPAAAEIDGSDEPSQAMQLERSSKARTDESENLRRQQEWAAADYVWWKR